MIYVAKVGKVNYVENGSTGSKLAVTHTTGSISLAAQIGSLLLRYVR